MKKYFLGLEALMVVVLFSGCGRAAAELRVVHEDGFLFIDAIDGVRTKNEEVFTLAPGAHKIVYSHSDTKGLFAPPRTEFYVVTVNLPNMIRYEFYSKVDVLSGGKRRFTIAQAGNRVFVAPVKTWTEDEKEPFQF